MQAAPVDEKPLPPVDRVRPGLWSIPVPLPIVLRYVLVYAFETGLGQAGFEIGDVRGVMVTHIHPDHYGLAGRIREASGAWIALHPADAELIHSRYAEPTDLLARVSGLLRRAGAPDEEIATLSSAAMPVRPLVKAVLPDVLLEDGQRPEVPGWDLTAIWTPGHSPGHLCFWEAANEVLLTGDHVLPKITPNISFHPQAGANPLEDYLRSLDKLD